MNRKKLIGLALVIVMLLSCVFPSFQVKVNAASTTTMSFNTALYKGLKSYFSGAGISATYNDVSHTITMEQSVIESVTEIIAKEKEISDLTGLDYFTNLERVTLSSNELSEDSNLEVLNNLPNLTYLDLSTNNIKDVSAIQDLIESLIAKDSNSVNISNQVVNYVVDVPISTSEEDTKMEFELPQILQIAGIVSDGVITEQGYIWSSWLSETDTASSASSKAPYVIMDKTFSNPVDEDDNTFYIQTGSISASGSYTMYQGLVKLVITVKDTSNLLKDSVFTLYYVVHSSEYEGIIFNDSNLYDAVKEQLTEGQTVNSELLSYLYTTSDDEVYYDDCTYTYNESTGIATLYIDGVVAYYIYEFGTGNDYIVDADGNYYGTEYTKELVETVDNTGTITQTYHIYIAHLNEDSRNLYVDAYDEALALVITENDIVNKITSLILNDKSISDLSGLEYFVGLESNLNVSYNYIDTMEVLYKLQLTKDDKTSDLQESFRTKRTSMANVKTKVTTAYSTVKSTIESIEAQVDKINDALETISLASDTTSSDYINAVKTITDAVSTIYGDGTSDNTGLLGELDEALYDSSDGLNTNLAKLYTRLAAMYEVYNKEYRLISLLTPTLNYEEEDEYEEYQEAISTLAGAQSVVSDEISRIATLEGADALSSLEQSLIINAFGLSIDSEKTNPISTALKELYDEYVELEASKSTYLSMISKFQEIGIYANAANYCLLERMNNSTATEQCYVEEYLQNKIEDFTYEDIDTTVLEAIYNYIVDGTESSYYTSSLMTIFENYMNGYLTYTSDSKGDLTAKYCEGDYKEVTNIDYETTTKTLQYYTTETTTTTVDGTTTTETTQTLQSLTYLSSISLYEILENYYSDGSSLYFYNQLMALANKFTAIDEVSTYLILPSLKRLDVTNNNIETLGDITVTIDGTSTTENLTTLSNLREFYAAQNLIFGDINCVDWSELTKLKKLDLSYNYIEDISCLSVLSHLKYLNASDNLIAGSFNLAIKNMDNLEDLILAGNQIDDIGLIMTTYEISSGGNLSAYFAREDTLNLDLSRQVLTLDIDDTVQYDANAKVLEVELPAIFAQLEEIDTESNAFGFTSSLGSVDATGTYAYVPITSTGDLTAVVTVKAANGYPEDVTTSVGINTVCTITYSVENVEVTSVTINEEIDGMELGTSETFTATVEGTNLSDTTVTWSVSGNESTSTFIDAETGVLHVADDETATTITVTATSNYDGTTSDSKEITLYTKTVSTVTIDGGDTSVETGTTTTFTATVDGDNLSDDDQAVTWSLEGNNSSDTTISEDGVLTVADDETAETLTLTATSTLDGSVVDTITITLYTKSVTSVTVYSDTTAEVGDTVTFTAEVTGENLEDADKTVTWSVYGRSTPYTYVSSNGVLTISENETASTLLVAATSDYDTTKIGTAEVTISSNSSTDDGNTDDGDDDNGSTAALTLGYDLDDDDETLIIGVSPSTSSTTFKSILVSDDSYTVVVTRENEDGSVEEITTSNYVATGDIATIYLDGEVVAVYTIVVKGDVNGDGLANALDSSLIKAHRAKISTLTGEYLRAADIDDSGTVTVTDVRLLLYHRAKIDGYIL